MSPGNFHFPIILTGRAPFGDLIWHNMFTVSKIKQKHERDDDYSYFCRKRCSKGPQTFLFVFGRHQFLADSSQTESKLCFSSAEAKCSSTWCVIALKRPRKVKVTIIEKERQVKKLQRKIWEMPLKVKSIKDLMVVVGLVFQQQENVEIWINSKVVS